MPAVTGGFSQLISRDYEDVFYDEFTKQPKEWSQVAKVSNMDGAYENWGQMMGVKKLQEMHEGQELPQEDPEQGNEKQITPLNFGLAMQITRNMYEDDQYNKIGNMTKELAKASDYAQEVEFWDLLNSGFVTTAQTGIDSLAMFSSSHASLDGENTIDNDGTDATISTTSVQQMLDYFEKLVDERGRPIKMSPYLIVIPSDLQWKVKELLMSPFNPENANDQYNTVANEGLQYMICHHLTSTTAWFALARDHDLRFKWRRKIEYDVTDDFNTKNALASSTGRFVADFVHYRGMFGNSGA